MDKGKITKSIIVGAFLIVINLYAYTLSITTIATAEESAINGVVTGILVPPEGESLPDDLKVALFYPDREIPPEPYPGPFPTPFVPTPAPVPPTPTAHPIPRSEGGFGEQENSLELPELPPDSRIYERPIQMVDVDPSTGEFAFSSIFSGSYILKVIPPAGSALIAQNDIYVDLFQTNLDLGQIELVEAQISGALFEPDGETLADGYVTIFSENQTFYVSTRSVNGRYFLTDIPAGKYRIQAFPSTSERRFFRSEQQFITVADLSEKMTLPIVFKGPDLFGTVTDPSGRPMPYVEISVSAPKSYPIGWTSTDSNGKWEIGDLPHGIYELRATTFYQSELVPPDPVEVQVPNDGLPINLSFSEWPKNLKVIKGKLVDGSGVPATQGVIRAYHQEFNSFRETATDEEGNFHLDLIGGEWHLEIENGDYENADWIFPGNPVIVTFGNDNQTEEQNLTLKVSRYDSVLTGEVVSPVSDVPVSSFYFSLYAESSRIVIGRHFDQNGSFSITAPEGDYFYSIYPDNSYFAPLVGMQVSLKSGETVDLGQISLLAPTATVKGVVTNNSAEGVAGVPVYAHKTDGVDGGRYAITEEDGSYELKLTPGSWSISADTYQLENFIFDGEPITLTIGDNETIEGADFVLKEIDSVISGRIVASDGQLLHVNGEVGAEEVNGKPFYYFSDEISGGEFELPVVGGEYNLRVHVFDDTLFLPSHLTVSVEPGSTVDIEITAADADAKIVGKVTDVRANETVSGLSGTVRATSTDYTADPLVRFNALTGGYELPVASGTWFIDWRIDHFIQTDYVPLQPYGAEIGVEAGETATFNLPVVASDATISGKILDPDGAPLLADIRLEGVEELAGVFIEAHPNFDGTFSKKIPYGSYWLTAVSLEYQQEIFPPEPILIEIGAGETVSDLVVRFQQPDTRLYGTIFAQGLTQTGQAYVWLTSPSGGHLFKTMTVMSDGSNGFGEFGFDLTDGTWNLDIHMLVDYKTWFASGVVMVDGDTEIQVELTEGYPLIEPGSARWISGEEISIALENGAKVNIPAAAIDANLNVANIRLELGNYLPINGELIPVDHNYMIMAYDWSSVGLWHTQLNEPISVTVPYPAELVDTIDPSDLVVVVQSIPDFRNKVAPTIIEEIALDTDNQTITFEIDRLGYFGVMAPAELLPSLPAFSDIFGDRVYLPVGAR